MNIQASSTRTGRKMAQVLEGAREIFMRDGFDGASVDDIARSAGVSKATLYNYFPDKRMLFMEVAKAECCRQEQATDEMLAMSAPPDQALRNAAERMVRLFVSPFGKNVFRICVAEAERFPGIGQEFWESGPAPVRQKMIAYFKQAMDRGELKIDDLDLAADQFAELCKSDLFVKLLLGIQDTFSDDEIKRVANGAADMFMARYGT
ncbi:MAG: TetR/AcrR family transcriptional regulator [Pseudomonadota bacterium]